MKSHSKWIKTDLHIHSIESNKYKKNDYKGSEYTGEELLKVLISNSVGIFSITDHNSINLKLYTEIFDELKKTEYSSKISVLVGTELDIFDERLHDKRIHVLCIFESKDYKSISRVIKELTSKNSEGVYPDIKKIFSIFEKNDLFKFILIPHFNNKTNGLPSSDDQIDNLNRLIFNAYEDANNYVKLSSSLKSYLEAGFDNFPFVAFSDNHNLKDYPGWKSDKIPKEKVSLCSVLGDIEYPYNSIKTAFEEPRLRISIDNVELMRSTNMSFNYISIIDNNKEVVISPYMNTIIGPFGSGKSLIFNKLLNGLKNMPSRYNSLIDTSKDEFLINMDGAKVSSLKEAVKLKIIDKIITIDQYEELVYIDKIDNNYIKKLSEKLDFNIPTLKSYEYDFDTNLIKENVDNILELNKEFSNSYIFNYDKAFFTSENYTIHKNDVMLKPISFQNIIGVLNENNYASLKELKISNMSVFNEEEQQVIDSFSYLLTEKIGIISTIQQKINEFRIYLNDLIDTFNKDNDFKSSKVTREHVKEIIQSYGNEVVSLFKNISDFSSKYNSEKHDELVKKQDSIAFDEYLITCKYSIDDKIFEDINTKMFSINNKKESFFISFVNAIDNSSTLKLKSNKPFSNYLEVLNNYKQNAESIFKESNLCYDILVGDKKKSILRFSPGERSQEILKMVFQRIIDGIKRKLKTVVIIDQPENNMDNHNIMTLLVDKIKETKLIDRENLTLFIFVTHNANICITSDSENIIIAQNIDSNFDYIPGSIENENHISNVCEILEGGKEALNARASKYNINIRRKVTKNG